MPTQPIGTFIASIAPDMDEATFTAQFRPFILGALPQAAVGTHFPAVNRIEPEEEARLIAEIIDRIPTLNGMSRRMQVINESLRGALSNNDFGYSYAFPIGTPVSHAFFAKLGAAIKQKVNEAEGAPIASRVFTVFNTEVFRCPDCTGVLTATSQGREYEGQWWSLSAFNERWVETANEDVIPRGEARYVNGHGWVTQDEYLDGRSDGEWFTCAGCGDDFIESQERMDEDTDDSYCQSCYDDNGSRSSVIRCYSYRVDTSPYLRGALTGPNGKSGVYGAVYSDNLRHLQPQNTTKVGTRLYRKSHFVPGKGIVIPKFFGKQKSAPALRYAGIELEVECTSSTNRAAKAVDGIISNFAVLKSDGSIDDGFEIVSRPMTLDTHQTIWNDFFNKRPRGLTGYDNSTCGMHVHIGREGLTKAQIRKVAHFVSLPDNDRFLRSIAGRNSDEWARKYPKSARAWQHQIDTGRTDGRYSALNLTNDGTIEFRIFKSTLKKASFLRNIEFCFAICEWAADASRPASHYQNAELFAQWIAQAPQRKQYPHLALFLAGRWPDAKVYGVLGNRKFTFEAPVAAKVDAKEKPLVIVEPGVQPYDPDHESDDESDSDDDDERDEDDDSDEWS